MAANDPGEREPMSVSELKHRCGRLYGSRRWQTALSEELVVNARTVRRWAASPIPQSVAHCVRLMDFLDELSWLGEWRKLMEEEF